MRAFDKITAFYPEIAERRRDYGVYGFDFNTLAASAAGQEETENIDRDSDFIVTAIDAVITTDAAGGTEQSFPECLMQIRDSGSGQNWFNRSQHMGNVVGRNVVDGHGPLELARPRWIPAGSAVTVILQNLEATARRIWISFHGDKVYRGMDPIEEMPGHPGGGRGRRGRGGGGIVYPNR